MANSYVQASKSRGWNRGSAPVQRKRPHGGRGPLLAALAAVIAVLAFAVCWHFSATTGREDGEEVRKEAKGRLLQQGRELKTKGLSPREAVRNALKDVPKKRRKSKIGHFIKPSAIFAHLKGADRKFAEDVQNALDADDVEKTLKATEAAMTSANPEVRQYAVEALGWFGQDALPELTAAMSDPDGDVADAAENAWELAVNDIDDTDSRFSISMAAMSTLTNPDQLMSISGILSGAANELIDGCEDEAKAAQYRLEIVQALADVIDQGAKNCSEQAKEAYSDITGEDWAGVDAAEAYLYDQYDYDAAAAEQAPADGAAVAEDVEQGGES